MVVDRIVEMPRRILPERGFLNGRLALVTRPVDILVNNAAIYCPGTARDTSVRSWTEFQNVNLRAPWLLARTMAETLGPTGSGDVINLNDAAALHPRADHFAYTMSKWSLHGLTRNLAMALAPNIRVNELALGSVMPPDPGTGDYQHTPRENIPLDRFPRPEEVAAAMLHLLANASLTGQTLRLDGGENL
ncbi:hypothetical protein CSA17_00465 [bacterium DOLJORAL78_65_58]|nr:MAG: hypothetical protein CSA17_00465 [bacterium DOLJORAL78_65_58]